jgi:hypothetical protein
MKKTYVLVLVLLYTIVMIGCDKDECPVCKECACVCIDKSADSDECPVCHEGECICAY